ncbi:hypothetical protein D3C80_1249570 [compost metagenome]
MLQLCKWERAVIDHFIQHNALPSFQPGIFCPGDGLHDQLHMAGKHAALIILIAQFQPGFRGGAFHFAVGLRHHLCQTAFQLLTGEPGRACPDHT